MVTREQLEELRQAYGAGGYMRKKLADGSVVDVVKTLFDAIDEMARERNRFHSRVVELEHFKGDAERRTKEDISRRLLGAVGRVAGMEIAPGADAVEWTVNKLAGLDEELHRLRLELAAQQAEGRALRAQQIAAGRVRPPIDIPAFPEWDAEIARGNYAASLVDALPEHQIPTPERDAPARVFATLTRKASP